MSRRSPRAAGALLVAIGALVACPRALARQTVPIPPAPASQHAHHAAPETHALFPARDASGTAWLPDESPIYGAHLEWRGWQVMLHGTAFVQALFEPGDIHRTGGPSSAQAGGVNWGMAMARRPLGRGRLGVRAMLSAEPWTVPGCGYLNLLASGETCDGDTIHDRQHPHDLFMGIAADYDRPVRGQVRWQLYAGLAGEPALGPPGFPHRPSAIVNSIAPVSHHWLDSTHITFGLVTTGVYTSRWKAELSVFNAREPDEDRDDLDLGALDSIAGRWSLALSRRMVVQVSGGYLNESEAEFPPLPRADVNRGTASLTYHRASGETVWATTLAYGINEGREALPEGVFDALTQAALAETTVTIAERHSWFGRAEVVEKPAHDLHAHEYGASIFTIGKLQAGYVRRLPAWKRMVLGVGGTATLALVPEALASRYEGRVAPGFGVFVNVRPARLSM